MGILIRIYKPLLWLMLVPLFVLIGSMPAYSQKTARTTVVKGKVVDAGNGETLPFVQILFIGSSIGTTSNIDGDFYLENDRGLVSVVFRMVGYKNKTVTLKPNRVNDISVSMEPEVYALEDVVVKPVRKRERYRRKGNPAVDLIKRVIANKDKNRVGRNDTYMVKNYEKLVMAIEPFDYDLDRNRFWRDFKFLERYVDTMYIDRGVLVVDSGKVRIDSIRLGEDSVYVRVDSVVLRDNEERREAGKTTILTMSLRETLADEYYQSSPRKERKVITAKRWEGLDELFDNGGMSNNIQALFQPMNIFANDINLMLNRFVSPLSFFLACSFS